MIEFDLDFQDKHGWTALHWALKNNNMDVVEALIKGGTKLDIQDSSGMTALHMASETNNADVLKSLI